MLLKDEYNAKIKNIEDKTTDITNLATKITLDTKINEVKGEIPSTNNLAITTVLTAVVKYLMSVIQSKKLTITQKLMKLKRKLLTIATQNLIS